MARIDLLSERELGRIAPTDVILLPIGSIEPHGHLPLGTDRIIAEEILRQVSERLTGTWLFPTIPVGYNYKYDAWPGSIGIDSAVVERMISNLVRGVVRLGIRRIFVMSGHDENREAVVSGLRSSDRESGTLSVYCDWLELGWSLAKQLSSSRSEGHASEIQTSVVQFLCPSASYPCIESPVGPRPEETMGADDMFAEGESGLWIQRVPLGRASFTGDPSYATREKGRIVVERIVDRAIELVSAMKEAQLPSGLQHG